MFKPVSSLLTGAAKRFVQTSAVHLKGHSKWQNIKNIKADNDAIKAQISRRQMRFIRIAVNEGGSTNPERNLKLRFAIEEALRRDVPKSTVQTFLKKLADSKDKTTFQRHLFDGRLYKKLHFIIAIFTDSLPHAKIQIATVYRKHLVETTNSKRLFDERGVFNVIARDGITADNIEEECLNDADQCGADDFEVFNAAERKVSFFCDPKEFLKVQNKLTLAGYLIEHSECAFYPKTTAAQLSESELVDYGKFKTKLLNIDGFDEVYDNLAENDDS